MGFFYYPCPKSFPNSCFQSLFLNKVPREYGKVEPDLINVYEKFLHEFACSVNDGLQDYQLKLIAPESEAVNEKKRSSVAVNVEAVNVDPVDAEPPKKKRKKKAKMKKGNMKNCVCGVGIPKPLQFATHDLMICPGVSNAY